MIKTALIVPKGSKYGKNTYLKSFLERNDIVSKFYAAWETPNLSLLTLAGLFPSHYSLHFIDEDHGEDIPFTEGFDLVFVTGMTQQINRAYEICAEFKKLGSYTVLGGIHASIYPQEAGRWADTVIIGEGEWILPHFLKDFKNNRAKPLYNPEVLIDLKTSPIPRYDLVNTELYSSYSIQTTRGCPRTCGYCTLPIMYGSVYRNKKIPQVLAEIRAIKAIDPSPMIFFVDDNMFVDRESSLRLIRAVGSENVAWGTQTDISIADHPEILKALKECGCRWLFIGIENTSKNSLELFDRNKWKASMSDRFGSMVEKIQKAGINIWGSFMFGTDNDDESVFSNTLRFALEHGVYSASFTILTPLPGTELFKQMEKEKRIIDYDWSRYTFWDVVYKPRNLTEEQLAKGVAFMYDQFYSSANSKIRMAKIKKNLRESL